MIDWYNLASNSLWIIGLALALATFSYASWQASESHEKIRLTFGRSSIQIAINLAGLLFCAGLAATSEKTYEAVLWSALAFAFGIWIISFWFQGIKSRQKNDDHGI